MSDDAEVQAAWRERFAALERERDDARTIARRLAMALRNDHDPDRRDMLDAFAALPWAQEPDAS